MTVTSAQLHRTAERLQRVACDIEAARDRHEDVSRRLRSTVTDAGNAWVSPAADRFVADGRSLIAAAGRLPGPLGEAATRTRHLASSAISLAEEVAGDERAAAAAVAAVRELERRTAGIDPRDVADGRWLAERRQSSEQAHRRARSAIADCALRWDVECRETAMVVSGAAVVIRSAVSGPKPVGAVGTDFGAGTPGSAVDVARGLVRNTALETALQVHGLAFLGQQLEALRTMTRAWMSRGVVRAMAGPRALGAAAGRLATLRWDGIATAAGASRDASDAKAAQRTRWITDAAEVVRKGRGWVRATEVVAAPLGMVGDLYTLIEGSQYEGARGDVDRGMAVVGLASTAVLIAPAAIVASPIVVGAAVVGAAAATLWAIGNLVYEHRHRIRDTASRVGSGLASVSSAVVDGVADGASAIATAAQGV